MERRAPAPTGRGLKLFDGASNRIGCEVRRAPAPTGRGLKPTGVVQEHFGTQEARACPDRKGTETRFVPTCWFRHLREARACPDRKGTETCSGYAQLGHHATGRRAPAPTGRGLKPDWASSAQPRAAGEARACPDRKGTETFRASTEVWCLF